MMRTLTIGFAVSIGLIVGTPALAFAPPTPPDAKSSVIKIRSTDLVARLNELGIRYRNKAITAATINRLNYVSFRARDGRQLVDADCAMLNQLVKLTSIRIQDGRLSSGCLGAIAAIPTLKSLVLYRAHLEPGALAALNASTTITSLTLHEVTGLEPSSLGALQEMQQLRTLQLLSPGLGYHGDTVGDDLAEAVADLASIQRLSLSNAKLGPQGLAALARLPRLRSLGLVRSEISDEAVAAFVVEGPSVSSLNLSNIATLTPAALKSLAELKSLRQITISFTRLGPGLGALGSAPRLRRISATYSGVTDAALEGLTRARSLSSLDLAGNKEITSAGFAAIGEMTALENLVVSSTRLVSADLTSFASLGRLERLSLYNTDLTDEGLSHLLKLRLRFLNIGNTRVTAFGLSELLNVTSLKSVSASGSYISKDDAKAVRQVNPKLRVIAR